MCGIVGFAGNLEVKHERAFNDLLIMNQIRGFDSVGVVRVGYRRHPDVAKSLDDPATFVGSKEYTLLMKGQHNVLLGHNRAATMGTVTLENAHPFTHEHITGVHNGTLPTRFRLEDYKDFAVDSDNIFYHIAKKGVHDLWKKMYGAAALVWWDAKDETLNFIRNNERPMYVAFTKDMKVMCWASEFYMLQAACYRHGIILGAAPAPTKVDQLYTVAIGQGWRRGEIMKVAEEHVPAYEVYVPPARKWNDDNGTAYHRSAPRPDWLKNGETIPVIFEDVEAADGVRLQTYNGFCPKDDRINIIFHLPSKVSDPVDLSKKGRLYRAQISSIITKYVQGYTEYDVRVTQVVPYAQKDMEKQLKDEAEAAEMAELMRELNEDSEDMVPFDNADLPCRILCPYRERQGACEACQQAFGDEHGKWTFEKARYSICDWCGGFHRDASLIYLHHNGDESYCEDCFPYVVKWIANRDERLALSH